MKTIITLLSLLISTVALATENQFSAIVEDNTLYITTSLDTCNHHGLEIQVADKCSNQFTADYVTTCPVQFSVVSTEMACSGSNEPKVLSYDLDQLNLRTTINTLSIKRYGQESPSVDVKVPQADKAEDTPQRQNYFDAIIVGDELYVTALVDSCNSHSGGFQIAENCKAAAPGMFSTTDYVTTCKAKFSIKSTRMACRDTPSKLQSFSFSIKELNLRSTIDTLLIDSSYSPEPLPVSL